MSLRDRLYALAARVGVWLLDRADRVPTAFANQTHEEDT